MNNFERGKNPKESMGIGLEKNSVPLNGLIIEVNAYHKADGGWDRQEFPVLLKRRRKLKDALYMLNLEEIPYADFFKIFRIPAWADDESGKPQETKKSSAKRLMKKIRTCGDRKVHYGTITIDDGIHCEEIEKITDSSITVLFQMQTDIEEMRKVKEEEKELKGVKYKDHVYPINLEKKYLV